MRCRRGRRFSFTSSFVGDAAFANVAPQVKAGQELTFDHSVFATPVKDSMEAPSEAEEDSMEVEEEPAPVRRGAEL